ncbi:hypothetical protein ACPYO6_10380 [Georgenia sp. Z1344]|uniref:hypothetical protein n=1 Tax=Georgenia sp. Z1344 TaxID=3416706 RepID=UPI003CE722DE
MSARYAVVVRTGLDADRALARVLDPALHAEVVPLTTLRGRARRGPLLRGERFTMRTALGPLYMDDHMVVDRLRTDEAVGAGAGAERPGGSVASTGGPTRDRGGSGGAVRFVKTGRVLRGVVLARVAPAAGGAVVRWDAELAVAGVPRVLDPALAVVARLAYGAALRRILRPGAAPVTSRSERGQQVRRQDR